MMAFMEIKIDEEKRLIGEPDEITSRKTMKLRKKLIDLGGDCFERGKMSCIFFYVYI